MAAGHIPAGHRGDRRQWALAVGLGIVKCGSCGERIASGEPFRISHDYEHLSCWPRHASRCAPQRPSDWEAAA